MNKPFPHFKSDREAEEFVDTADLSEYDLSGFRPVSFVLDDDPEIVRIKMAPDARTRMLEAAARKGVSEDDFIRAAIDSAVAASAEQRQGDDAAAVGS